mgnify:FL=1
MLIVWHSMTGGTRQMAEAAAAAARLEAEEPAPDAAAWPLQVRLVHAREAGPDDVLAADGYLFATPECLAAMGGLMKDFFDRSYYAVLDHVAGRPYASLVCAGSDGQGAARQIARIATGWRLAQVAEPLIVCTRVQTSERILAPKRIKPDDLQRCQDLGAAMAAGLRLGVF